MVHELQSFEIVVCGPTPFSKRFCLSSDSIDNLKKKKNLLIQTYVSLKAFTEEMKCILMEQTGPLL